MPLNVVLPVPFALVTLPECGNQGPQGNESDECLDNQIGDVYNDVKSHWMVTGLASWGDNSNSEEYGMTDGCRSARLQRPKEPNNITRRF